jgi:hypothetical protein
MGIRPQALLLPSCFLLQALKFGISWSILSVPSVPTLLDEFLIDVRSIRQEHISEGVPLLVFAVSLNGDLLAKHKLLLSLLCS